MKYVIAAILIAAGGCLIFGGHRRARSIEGIAERTGKDIADAFDGRMRHPHYAFYYAGGLGLIAVGVWVALRKQQA